MNKEMIDEELTLKGLKRNLYEYRFQRSNYVHEMWLKSIEDMEQENKQLKDTIDKVRECIKKFSIDDNFTFPLMKRDVERQVKSSIKYEFDTSIKKDLLSILGESE